MKHIVLFSGGCASTLAGQIVAQKNERKDVVLLHTPTYSEHPDADRFRCQVARHIGLPITVWGDGRSVWDLIDCYGRIPDARMQFCTERLKISQTYKFLKSLDEGFIVYYGYDADEWKRVQKAYARNMAKGIEVRFPLFERGIKGEEAKNIIRDEWGICLPEPYKYLKHNNCLPCFKGGKKHFYEVWLHYPDKFYMAEKKEEETGHTVFKNISLRELREQWEAHREMTEEQISLFDYEEDIPCMCAL